MEETWSDLKEIALKCKEKLNNIEKYKVVLFGAGALGTRAYETIKEDMKIEALADNNTDLIGKRIAKYDDLIVLAPEELENQKGEIFVIVIAMARHYNTIEAQLKEKGIRAITYMEYVLAKKFIELEYVYNELLQDEESKKTYLSVILGYLKNDLSYLKKVYVRNQYFEVPEFSVPVAGDVFVDCGAYVGDSIETYLATQYGIVDKVYAFEPTEKCCIAMRYRMERLAKEWALEEEKLIIEQKVVGLKNGVEYFSKTKDANTANAVADKKNNGTVELESVSLDMYFENKQEKPTFIKADVEGSELDLLLGAKNIITQNKPRLAICVYHKIDDLFRLPILIKKYNPEYKMELRHHSPNYYETVLYCY